MKSVETKRSHQHHKRRVTLQPSSKTSYVVIGQDSRPRKTEKLGILLYISELIRGSFMKSDVDIKKFQSKISKSKDLITAVASPALPKAETVTQLCTEIW